jgi:hypothetical protein
VAPSRCLTADDERKEEKGEGSELQ